MPPKQGQSLIHRGRTTDARGMTVSQLDPVAMYLLHRHGPIAADDLRAIATDLDPDEVRKRRWNAIAVLVTIILVYAGFFGYFKIFNRGRGWDPVMVGFVILNFVYLPTIFFIGCLRARRRRLRRIRGVMLRHRHCPHCGYDIHGLTPDAADGATIWPECGCAWNLEDAPASA